jgi:hypothetical protein
MGCPALSSVGKRHRAYAAVCPLRTGRPLESYLSPLCLQYDAVPIQSSVVLCACPSPSMVRTQTESGTASGIPGSVSRQGHTMDSTTAESRPSTNPLQHAAQPPPQPRKKRPEDFKFGKILGEGSFSTVSMSFCWRSCWLNKCVSLGMADHHGAWNYDT